MASICVVIPHLPERERELYWQACQSVLGQTRKPDQFIVEWDPEHTGCAATQNRALARVRTEWVALLGDDDYFLPEHLAILEAHVTDELDVIWPDFVSIGQNYSFCMAFDGESLMKGNYIPGGGSLIRTAAARAVGGWCKPGDADWDKFEDWVMWKRLYSAGHHFLHVCEKTWAYRFHPAQTGGQA
jgi:glycosyltransferase involved in cell wall biosynthesis